MTPRTTRRLRAGAAVPLALVTAAWTTQLSGSTAPQSASAPTAAKAPSLPDGTVVPPQAIDNPASLSDPSTVLDAGDAKYAQVAVAPAAGDLPSGALAAYQRAETIINAADPDCGLQWQLVAAIGRVESDHGRYGGATIGPNGRVSPAIVGVPLDGSNGTALIRDTDAGQYDGDARYDRAVGPMQFIPSTWAVVGVDADNDGVRDPQDIDDAALATAVYLCSGDDDLSTATGRRPAVFRYNHSNSYVELVLSIMDSYLEGRFDTSTAPVVSAGYVTPLVGRAYGSGDGRGPGAKPAGDVLGEPGLTLAGPLAVDTDDDAPALPTGGSVESAVPTKVPPVDVGDGDETGELPPAPGDGDGEGPAGPGEEEPTTGPGEENTTPGEEPAGPGEPGDTGETGEPGEPGEPAPAEEPAGPGDGDTAEPGEGSEGGEPGDEATIEPGAMTPEEAAAYCTEEGLENVPTDDADQYDICVAESSGRSAPATPHPEGSPLPDEATTGRD